MFNPLHAVGNHPPSLTISLIFSVNSILAGNWLVRIPEIQERLALSEGELGLCLFGVPAGAVVIMPMMGWISSRWGAGRVTLVTALAFCLATILPTLSWSMASFISALLLVGFTSGAMDIAMNAEAAAIEERRGVPIMSTCHGFWSLGAMAGAAMGGLVASLGVPLSIHITAVATALIVLVLARKQTLWKPGPATVQAGPTFALPNRPLIGLALIAFCGLLGEGAIADWGAVYLKNYLGTGAAVAGFGYAAFSGAMALGRLYGDQVATRFSAAAIVRYGALSSVIGMSVALAIPYWVAALAGFALVGLGLACIVPIVYRAAARAPGMLPGTNIAAVASAGYAGLFTGPPLIGFTAEAVGLRSALVVIVLLSFMIVVIAPNVFPLASPKQSPESISNLR